MTFDSTPVAEASGVTYCANHPTRETSLRCNRCGKPICAKCARRIPTGYRCPECVSQQQQTFETALWHDYLIAATVSAVLSGIGSVIASILGFFILFVAPMAGGIIVEVVFRAVRKRRSRYMPWVVVGGIVAGSLPACALPVLATLLSVASGEFSLQFLLGLLWPTIYVVLAASTAFYRLRGIRIG